MSVYKKIAKNLGGESISAFLIALILICLPLGYAFSSIFLGVFVIYSISLAIVRKQKIHFNWVLFLPVILYLLFCLTYFWSVDKSLTLKGLLRTVPLLLVPFTFSLLSNFSKHRLNLILNILTKSNIVFGLYFILTSLKRYIYSNDFEEFTYHNLVSSLDLNAIYVSAFFIISIFYLFQKPNKSRIDYLSAFFLILILLLLSSKVFFIILALGVIIYIFRFLKIERVTKKKVLIIAFAGTIIFILSSRELTNRVLSESNTNLEEVLFKEKFNKIYPWTGTSIRMLQLRILYDQIKEDKILYKGFGLFASRDNIKKRHLQFNTYYGYHSYNYHNTYAQILSESGIFGLLAILSILIVNLIKALKSKSFVFLMFSLLLPIWFLTESVIWVQRGVFFFIIFFCLFNNIKYAKP